MLVVVSDGPLHFCGVSDEFSFFVSDFIDLGSLFFLPRSNSSFINFIYLFKELYFLNFPLCIYFFQGLQCCMGFSIVALCGLLVAEVSLVAQPGL